MKEKEMVSNLKKISTFNELFKECMFAVFPSKKRLLFLVFTLAIIFPKLYQISFSDSTIQIFDKVITITNNFSLSIFGALMTAYSILFTLVRTEILELLISFPYKKIDKNENKKNIVTIWEYVNHSMVGTLISFLIIIIINYSLGVFLSFVGENWFSPLPNIFNNSICLIFIVFYLGFTLNALIEIKSFIYSLTQIFYINNLLKLKEHKKEQDNNIKNE